MSTNYEQVSVQHSLQFSDSLMDLKNLKTQLYSAAEHFESSYDKDEHKQLGISQQSLINDVHNPKYHKRYTSPAIDKSNFSWRNCKSSPENDTFQTDQGNSFSTAFQKSRVKPQTPVFSKGHSRTPSYESSPKPLSFSVSRVISNKESGKRVVSPLRFPLKRSGSVAIASTSVSPIRSVNQRRWPSEPRRATLGSTKPDPTNNREIESYTKKSKHLFKALLSIHRSKKDTIHNGLYRD